jgi:Restriction endonuclease/AAA ATPase domain
MMRIEVATRLSASQKDKGDLLEELSERVLQQQQFQVESQVRKTASELDLLCKHKVSGRTMYAECKAHRDNLSANVLKNVLGTLHLHEYDEAWLITTGPLGKDAKGFVDEWNKKPSGERQRLSVYSPERLIELLCSSNFVIRPPVTDAEGLVAERAALGEWTLLLTEYGLFWAVVVLVSGVPSGTLVFDAKSGQPATDVTMLRRIGETDTSLANLDLEVFSKLSARFQENQVLTGAPHVVQVQSGDDRADYRPARPEHFVGRKEAQDRLLELLTSIRVQETRTRVFAVTGDSGMGKSSLIAKLRDRCANVRNRGKFFLYAVDVRAATDPIYIHASLIAALNCAAQAGYGSAPTAAFNVSNYSDPLASESIAVYLDSLDASQQVLCLVFDQFEELYSKPELFAVFEEAQKLFLSAIGACSSLMLGFAWKTDSTVQQGHPAYFMWHRLADHRFEVGLSPFTHSEASTALTVFERAIETRIRPELRRQLIESSQGFPWLVKKLCLHLWEQIRQGTSQEELADTLDVASLFDRDLQSLTKGEATCLKAVAKSAPADWSEILDTYGEEVLRALQQRRLVVRSGDRLNVYWDIFRDYLLTSSVPSLPYTYLPSSPSIRSFLSVAALLDHEHAKTLAELSQGSGVKEGTAQNIIHDLLMFGVATGSTQHVVLDERAESASYEHVLLRMRDVLRRHALTRQLGRYERGETIRQEDMINTLKAINRAAQHRARTWRLYADRMGRWLVATGLAVAERGGWRLQDRGDVLIPKTRRQRLGVFLGDAPPARVLEAMAWLKANGPAEPRIIKAAGFRNAVSVLQRFGIARSAVEQAGVSMKEPLTECTNLERLWHAAQGEDTIRLVAEFLDGYPSADDEAIASHVVASLNSKWTRATRIRVGNGLRQWAQWTLHSSSATQVPPAPRRRRKKKRQTEQYSGPTLFGSESPTLD